MSDPAPGPLFLYEVLIAEYQSQQLAAAMPLSLLAGLADLRRRREAEPAAEGVNAEACRRQLDLELSAHVYRWLHAAGAPRSALCFSGGGIRSASFGLGVLQGLARLRLIGRFDYLSTVSGGGYLGGWLTAWIHREHMRAVAAAPGGEPGPASDSSQMGPAAAAVADAKTPGEGAAAAVRTVEAQLGHGAASPVEPEAEAVRRLRSYTRYMSPQAGFLSADTWTLISIYGRNVLLNWTVLLPLIAAALMFPRLSTAIVRLAQTQDQWTPRQADLWEQGVLWAAAACGVIGFAYLMINRPGAVARGIWPWTAEARRGQRDPRSQASFLVLCLLPLWLFAFGLTVYWAWVTWGLTSLGYRILGVEVAPGVAFTLFGAAVSAGGFALSRVWVRFGGLAGLGELIAVAANGGLGGLLAWALAMHCFPDLGDAVEVELYVCIAGPLLLLVFLLAGVLFVGAVSRISSDEDREWMARAGSWLTILIVMRGLISAVVVFGPLALAASAAAKLSLGTLGGISGLTTLLIGRSAKTSPGKSPEPSAAAAAPLSNVAAALGGKLLLGLALPVFCLFLLAVVSLLTSLLMNWLQADFLPAGGGWTIVATSAMAHGPQALLNIVYNAPWQLVVLVAALLSAAGVGMGYLTNINKFSLHAAYRDRLIRAYLGASRLSAERRPNPFTGFDERDNLQMCELRHPRPLHVLNVALNLVGGSDLAWQDRKAAPFSVSRLHSGSSYVGYRSSTRYGYSSGLDRAISLGTAVAISGAAASPNMGYHSSPLVTFLMTLFNVRLGWWLGNPGAAGDRYYASAGPSFGPRPLLAEAFGLTTARNRWVYLSDGGHFENLGLYEMVMRRCRFIVVSDGGQDPKLQFEDLGNAVSKIRIDFGIPILFEKLMMQPRDAQRDGSYDLSRGAGVPYCAVGRICYSCVDRGAGGAPAGDGVLLYIKASLNGTEPVDVYHYARTHADFPHEPTENQLYTEAQFESYRALGSHIVDWIAGRLGAELPAAPSIDQLVAALHGRGAVASGFGTPPECGGQAAAAAPAAAATGEAPVAASS